MPIKSNCSHAKVVCEYGKFHLDCPCGEFRKKAEVIDNSALMTKIAELEADKVSLLSEIEEMKDKREKRQYNKHK